jgi:RNA polymerase sigma factor (sigma-70 family)
LLDRCRARLPAPSQAARRKEAIDGLRGALAQLPADYREVVERLYLREEPLPEVALRLRRSPDAVRRMAGRAMDRLAQLISAEAYDTRR